MNLKNQLSLIKRIGRSIIYWSVCVTHNLWGAYEGNTRSEMCKVQGSMSRSNVYTWIQILGFKFYFIFFTKILISSPLNTTQLVIVKRKYFNFESPKYNSIGSCKYIWYAGSATWNFPLFCIYKSVWILNYLILNKEKKSFEFPWDMNSPNI
jgi:hypothetical protein